MNDYPHHTIGHLARSAKYPCEIFQGQFPSERAVVVRDFEGRQYSFFADCADLELKDTGEVTESGKVYGFVHVGIVMGDANRDEVCTIFLPRATIEGGTRYLNVHSSYLVLDSDREKSDGEAHT